MKTFLKQIRDIPDDVCESVVAPISHYTVLLVYRGRLKGSGTFVQCGDLFGVLTAHHVIHRGARLDFSSASTDDLGLSIDSHASAFYMPLNRLTLIDIGVPVTEMEGPDLSFISIPPGEHLSILRAKKSFWNLNYQRLMRLAGCARRNGGWCLAYHANERTQEETDERGGILYFPANVGWGSVRKSYTSDGYDYCEMGLDPPNEKKGIPNSFGGASGGGLWKVPLSGDPNGRIEAGKPILAGVIYFQTQERTILCHGPMSIYERVYEALIQRTNKSVRKEKKKEKGIF